MSSEETKFDFKNFENISNKDRYERRLAKLESDGKETSSIKKVSESSIKNLKENANSFIIYGEPQCGKTEMMIALSAKLLDEGHKIIVVLVTDVLSLLNQNLNRFRDAGIDPSPKRFDEILDPSINLKEGKWIIFSKKNASDLQKLVDRLRDIEKKVIIDDEADYATPNSRIKKQEKSKINELTETLIGTKGIYIGVTATPARLDLNNTHNNQNQKWIYFEPHSKYTGQDIFFPINTEKLDYTLNFIPNNEDGTKHIKNALFSFMINVAHLNLKINANEIKYSFLVHTSGKKSDHLKDHQDVVKIFNTLQDKTNANHKQYYEDIWEMTKKKYPGEETEITSYIVENNQRNNVVTMNSDRDFNTDSASITTPSALFTIIVGGNIISRGVTFDNLLSMFFTRRVKTKLNQDTYIQRARMFGSRGKYIEHFELFIPEELYYDWHNCFVLHRLSLKSIESDNGPPVWVYDNRTAVTSASSIDPNSVLSNGGEMGFGIFEFNENVETILNDAALPNFDKLKKLSELGGKKSLPSFLLDHMKLMTPTDIDSSIKIHKPADISNWGDETDKEKITRARGFISTSSKDFENYAHHIQILYNSNKKARIYYKPSSGPKLGFYQNIKWLR